MIKLYEVAYVKATDEPVFVNGFSQQSEELTLAEVRRRVDSPTGSVYQTETFDVRELQSEEDRLVRELEFTKLNLTHRERYAAEYDKTRTPKKAIPAVLASEGTAYDS